MLVSSLRVRARAGAHVCDPRALAANERSYIGHRYNPEAGAFEATGDAVSVPNTGDLRRAVRDGDLVPADAETARACGVPFVTETGGASAKE